MQRAGCPFNAFFPANMMPTDGLEGRSAPGSGGERSKSTVDERGSHYHK